MRQFFLLCLLFVFSTNIKGQILQDNFSDGDFSTNPTWFGADSAFTVNASLELQLNRSNPSSNNLSELQTAVPNLQNALVWEFRLRMGFNPSGSNLVNVYLQSDNSAVGNTQNGYVLVAGTSADVLELQRLDAGVATPLLTGTASALSSSAVDTRVKIIRTATGEWLLFADYSGGNNYQYEGTATDATYTSGTHFGFECKYTSTRADKFFFDDVRIYQDNTAPSISQTTAISSTEVDVYFDEAVDNATANDANNYDIPGLTVNSATIDGANPQLVHLTTTTISSGSNYTLTVNGVEDLSGNAASSATSNFTYILVQAAAAGDIIFNEIFPDPTPIFNLPDAEYVELYNRSNKIIDLNGLVFNDGSDHTLGNYLLYPDSVVAICANSKVAQFAAFGNIIGVSSVTLTNGGEELTLKDAQGATIDSINYDLSWYNSTNQGGYSIELINPNLTCQGTSNWQSSTSAQNGTPGLQNSVYDNTPDTQGPSLVSAQFNSATEISLTFNETLDATAATTAANYSITGGLNILSANFTAPNLVDITLDNPMTNNTSYTITALTGLTDCSGNAIGANNNATINYFTVAQATYREIIFTEIYADYAPSQGLPAQEYLEIYNPTSKTLDLSGVVINDGSNKTISSGLILPGEYIIICSNSNVSTFSPFGKVVGISSLSLSNGGEHIYIQNANGDYLDSLSYDLSWYRDANKDDGGYALELINPTLLCKGKFNWMASAATIGGTPGTQNSVYDNTPDTQGPSLVSVNFTDSTTLVLEFDETLDATSASNSANYLLAGNNITAANFQAPSTVILNLGANLVDQTTYALNVQNTLMDCSMNPLVSGSGTFTYYNIQPAAYQEVIFNELFIDPTPSVGLPTEEYIELHNPSNKAIDLKDYYFTYQSLTSSTVSTYTLESHLLLPGEYVLLIKDDNTAAFAAFPNVLALPAFPSLSNTAAKLELYNNLSSKVDSLTYTDDWYRDDQKDEGGYSLELINPYLACKASFNWMVSQNDTLGGTPGTENSVYQNTPDNIGPNIATIRQYSNNQIYLEFDDVLDPAQAANYNSFFVSGGLQIVTAIIVNERTIILTLASNMSDKQNYTVDFTGLKDCVGNVTTNPSATFQFFKEEQPAHYDIIINEIFPDYDPQVGLPMKEYVELYNRSDKYFNLENYIFSDGSAYPARLPYFLLAPGEYVILCNNEDTASFAGFTANVLEVDNFPNMSISKESIELADANYNTIDAVSYTSSWWRNSEKESGGWSLERVNPQHPCEGDANWTASIHPIGGTPGTQNSVFESGNDQTAPDVLRAFPVNADSVRIYFSEAMDDLSASLLQNFAIDNGITIKYATLEAPYFNTILLTLDNSLTVGTRYTFTTNTGLTDCVGNPVGLYNTASFALPEVPVPGDIILNEILFNPASGVSDFIELYNNSSKVINLGDLVLANTDDAGLINQTDVIESNWLLFPGEYVAFSEEPIELKAAYTTTNPEGVIYNDIPSMNDDEGTIMLYYTSKTNANYVILDSFYYSDDYHTTLLDDEEGVSLERIDFNAPTQDADNWHSAATAVGYATPAYQNSSYQKNDIEGDDILQVPNKTFSPDGDGFEDFLLINYNVDGLDYVANVTIYDAKGRFVKPLAQSELLMTEGTFQWDGTTEKGNKAIVGIYLIAIEVYKADGTVKRYKKSCVLAGKFD